MNWARPRSSPPPSPPPPTLREQAAAKRVGSRVDREAAAEQLSRLHCRVISERKIDAGLNIDKLRGAGRYGGSEDVLKKVRKTIHKELGISSNRKGFQRAAMPRL